MPVGKAFAECNTRQRASVESPSGKGCFAECQISSSQVLYIETTLQVGHGDYAPACDPGDGPGADGLTCDAGDPSNWFDAAPDVRCTKKKILHVSDKIKM